MGKSDKSVKVINEGPMGFILFVAYCGAAVYFVEQSSGFFGFIWALIKAIAWPALLIYNALEAFHV